MTLNKIEHIRKQFFASLFIIGSLAFGIHISGSGDTHACVTATGHACRAGHHVKVARPQGVQWDGVAFVGLIAYQIFRCSVLAVDPFRVGNVIQE